MNVAACGPSYRRATLKNTSVARMLSKVMLLEVCAQLDSSVSAKIKELFEALLLVMRGG